MLIFSPRLKKVIARLGLEKVIVKLGVRVYDFITDNQKEPINETQSINKIEGEIISIDSEKGRKLFGEHNPNKIYENLEIEEVLFDDKIETPLKRSILKNMHNYSEEEIDELLETAAREKRKAKLMEAKSKLASKAMELFSKIKVDERQPIAEGVKLFVWQRDGGKCVKCGKQENLEFDHIIPVSKGGSSTKRNVQLLCEKCNRTKLNKIVF